MRRIALAGMVLLPLGGCTFLANTFGGTPDQPTKTAIVETFIDACSLYAGALKDAATAANAGLLSDGQKAKIHAIRPPIEGTGPGTGVCPPNAPEPVNATAALVTVVQATASIKSAIAGN